MIKTKQKRRLKGMVVSDKMAKTIVVRVDRTKKHPKYGKYFTVSKRYQVHDERNEFHPGDTIEFEECRPISRTKRWRAIRKL